MIILRSNSHRASDKLRKYYNLSESYYHENMFKRKYLKRKWHRLVRFKTSQWNYKGKRSKRRTLS